MGIFNYPTAATAYSAKERREELKDRWMRSPLVVLPVTGDGLLTRVIQWSTNITFCHSLLTVPLDFPSPHPFGDFRHRKWRASVSHRIQRNRSFIWFQCDHRVSAQCSSSACQRSSVWRARRITLKVRSASNARHFTSIQPMRRTKRGILSQPSTLPFTHFKWLRTIGWHEHKKTS